MSHPEQVGFLKTVSEANITLLENGKILEIGSYDVNGSMRSIFDTCSQYVGVDLREGPGVDVIGFGHEVDFLSNNFDMTVSGECFEHDPNWVKTLNNMIRMTRPGGIVAFTCASEGRPEHGTKRTDAEDSPGTQSVGLDYYQNLTVQDIVDNVNLEDNFSSWGFAYLPTTFDLYFAGIKKGYTENKVLGKLPDSAHINALVNRMPLPHKIIRTPLYITKKILPLREYNKFAWRYWTTADKIQNKVLGRRRRGA